MKTLNRLFPWILLIITLLTTGTLLLLQRIEVADLKTYQKEEGLRMTQITYTLLKELDDRRFRTTMPNEGGYVICAKKEMTSTIHNAVKGINAGTVPLEALPDLLRAEGCMSSLLVYVNTKHKAALCLPLK